VLRAPFLLTLRASKQPSLTAVDGALVASLFLLSLVSPPVFLPSWLVRLSSASRLIPYVRQAVTFSVRRHLAACVRDAYCTCSAEAAPWLASCWLSPNRQLRTLYPPVPLLESSDALDVVVGAVVPPQGGRLSRLLLSQVLCPVPLPSSGVPCCSMWVLLPLVQVLDRR
jgi:hypothetical protein